MAVSDTFGTPVVGSVVGDGIDTVGDEKTGTNVVVSTGVCEGD